MGTNRTECIFLHVSPEIKAKLENCATDEKMQEQIIREYIEREKNWMNDSLEQLEKEELIYKCSLIKIKDSFGKAQDAYADEIAKLIDVSLNKNNELRVEMLKAENMITKMGETVAKLSKAIESLPILYRLEGFEKMLSIIEKFNKLSDRDREIVKYLIDKQ